MPLKSKHTTSPLVFRAYTFPSAKTGAVKALSLDDVCRAKFLVAVRRRFGQDQIAHLGQHQQLSADGNQTVEPELRFRPLDLAGLPIQATQRSGRAPGAFGVVAVGTEQKAIQQNARVPMAGQALLFPQRRGIAGHVEQRATECTSCRDEHLRSIHHRVGCVDPDGLASLRGPDFLAIGRVDDGQCPRGVDRQVGLLADLERHRCRMATGAHAGFPERLAGLGVERHAAGAAVQDQLVAQDERRTREAAESRRPDPVLLHDVARPDHLAVSRIQGKDISLATERVDHAVRDSRRRKRAVVFLDPDLLIAGVRMRPDDLAGGDVDAEDGVGVIGVAHGVGTVTDDGHRGVADADIDLPQLFRAVFRPVDRLG